MDTTKNNNPEEIGKTLAGLNERIQSATARGDHDEVKSLEGLVLAILEAVSK